VDWLETQMADPAFMRALAVESAGVALTFFGLVLLTTLGAYLADRYQRTGKVKELRFSVFQQASDRYHKLIAAAWHYFNARVHKVSAQKGASMLSGKSQVAAADSTLDERSDDFTVAYVEAESLVPVLTLLYGNQVSQEWATLIALVQQCRRTRLLVSQHAVLSSIEQTWGRFVNASARQLYLKQRDPGVGLVEDDVDEALREELQELDDWLELHPAAH